MNPVLFIFLDGVGLGPDDPEVNPFVAAALPTLDGLLGGRRPLAEQGRLVHAAGREAALVPLDATLGVPGLPQSGTGQTTLFTGRNAAREFGRHFGPWVPVGLRPVLQGESLFRRILDSGGTAAFANAYPHGWAEQRGSRRPAGPPLMAHGAGLLNRHHGALARGEAVASEIVNRGWRNHLGFRGPEVTPAQAGRNLAGIAADHDFTLYAHYATDVAGHRGGMEGATAALQRVDAFLAGVLERLPEDHLLLVTSDHGNVEDVRAGHTRNPVPGLLVGPGAPDRVRGLQSITQVTSAVLRWLAR